MKVTRRQMLDGLIRHHLLIPTESTGIYGTGRVFEELVETLNVQVTALGKLDGAELMRFPPVTSTSLIERCGYLTTFPHLLGMVHAFCGNEHDHLAFLSKRSKQDRSWSESRAPLDVVLTPAACYPVYPILARRGAVPDGGYEVDVASYCFRNEPSDDPARLQAFRLREFVRVGAPMHVIAFRDAWLDRSLVLAKSLGLSSDIVPANDPFFGTQRSILSDYQNENGLKFELRCRITDEDDGTACMSFNSHLDHFARACDMRDRDGEFSHSACVGFGLERLAFALIAAHGFEVEQWIKRLGI